MCPSEPVPGEVLALAVSIAIERRRLAVGSTLAAAGPGMVQEDPADDVRWRWGAEVGGWS